MQGAKANSATRDNSRLGPPPALYGGMYDVCKIFGILDPSWSPIGSYLQYKIHTTPLAVSAFQPPPPSLVRTSFVDGPYVHKRARRSLCHSIKKD